MTSNRESALVLAILPVELQPLIRAAGRIFLAVDVDAR